jgi:hypothetical protein
MSQDIDDPKKGVAYCNQRIRKLEEMAETARLSGDMALAAKCEGHIVAWAELLQHWVRMDYQTGGQNEDISKALSNKGKKSRLNA